MIRTLVIRHRLGITVVHTVLGTLLQALVHQEVIELRHHGRDVVPGVVILDLVRLVCSSREVYRSTQALLALRASDEVSVGQSVICFGFLDEVPALGVN